MKNTQQVRLVSTLNVSADELARARNRIHQPQWQAAAANLRKMAEEALADATPLPQMDTAWYDADPDRPFSQTYIPFHYFIDPAAAVMNRARTLAWAAMILDDRRYLERARQLFLHVVGGIACHVQHHDAGMQYGLLVVPMAELYTCLAGELTDAEHQLSRDKMTQAAEATLRGTQHWLTVLKRMPYSNHLAFQRHGLLSVALVLGRKDWIAEAIDGTRGFGEMLAGATFDDGLCYESSTHYHYATLSGLFNMAQLEIGRAHV